MLGQVLALAAAGGRWPPRAATEGGNDRAIAGTLTTQVVPGPELRTQSTWRGDLVATSRFTLVSLDRAPEARYARFRGDLIVAVSDGELIGQDDGTWDLATGAYVDVYTARGAGALAGATAVILLWGTLDPSTGQGESYYCGLVTHAAAPR